jgi:hypothetical protein
MMFGFSRVTAILRLVMAWIGDDYRSLSAENATTRAIIAIGVYFERG